MTTTKGDKRTGNCTWHQQRTCCTWQGNLVTSYTFPHFCFQFLSFLSGCSQGLAWCRSWTAALRPRRRGIGRVQRWVQIWQRWEETKEVTEVTGFETPETPETPESLIFFPGKIHWNFVHPDEDLAGWRQNRAVKHGQHPPKLSGRV